MLRLALSNHKSPVFRKDVCHGLGCISYIGYPGYSVLEIARVHFFDNLPRSIRSQVASITSVKNKYSLRYIAIDGIVVWVPSWLHLSALITKKADRCITRNREKAYICSMMVRCLWCNRPLSNSYARYLSMFRCGDRNRQRLLQMAWRVWIFLSFQWLETTLYNCFVIAFSMTLDRCDRERPKSSILLSAPMLTPCPVVFVL